MFRVCADNPDNTLSSHHLTLFTPYFNRTPDLHLYSFETIIYLKRHLFFCILEIKEGIFLIPIIITNIKANAKANIAM